MSLHGLVLQWLAREAPLAHAPMHVGIVESGKIPASAYRSCRTCRSQSIRPTLPQPCVAVLARVACDTMRPPRDTLYRGTAIFG